MEQVQSSKQIAVRDDEDLTQYTPESQFLKAKSLVDHGLRSIQAKISDVSVSEYSDGKKQVTLHLPGKDGTKLFGLNKINRDTIFAMYGTRKSDLIGKVVTIYLSKTQYNGQTVDCLRIDDRPTRQIEGEATPVADKPKRISATGFVSQDYSKYSTSTKQAAPSMPDGPDRDEVGDDEIPF